MIDEKFYMFDNNIVSFLLLGLLLIVIIVKKDIFDHSRKLFYRMVIINMILLLVEVLAWAFDGINMQYAIIFNYVFNCLLILFEPIMASMWLSYVDFKIFGSIERLKKRIYYLHASIFAAVLLIINIFEPVAFYLDADNVYHRGPWLWLSLIFVFVLVLSTVVLAYKNRKTISDNMIRFIAIFAFIPVIISLVQMFVYGLILTWAIVALGVVFAYYLIEISGNDKDYLTKLYSRKKIEEVLRGKIEKKENFTVLMIDLEFFKEVNDKYGHKTGDDTLIHFSKVLVAVFERDNFVSRIGGDEFLVVCNQLEDNELNKCKERLREEVRNYSDCETLREIGISIGAKVFTDVEGLNFDLIFDDVDELMYKDKNANKRQTKKFYNRVKTEKSL
jgi:diguanylate cyclase (GGDEF)-like protein